ncbi:ATPase [Sulfolobus acidocaldarius SUSAZ]|nr:ATPase [Sulfolobus acidocaldarius SUSAZ]
MRLSLDLKVLRLEIQKTPLKGVRSLLKKLDHKIVLVDEVQNVVSPWFLSLLSNVYNESEIRFVFTGSMIGLSKALSGEGKGKVSSVLKGKPILSIEIYPFSEELGRRFLKTGSERCGIELSEDEIEESVMTYRGIQGWLTYYGSFRNLGYSHNKAKDMVKKVAEGVIKDELGRLSDTQRAILRSLCLVEEVSWKELKNLTEGLTKREFKDWVFNHALKQLVNARLVKKDVNGYRIIDPMYKTILNEK